MNGEGLTYQDYEEAIPDLHEVANGVEGTCPHCGKAAVFIKLYEDGTFEEKCPNCTAPEIRDGVRSVIHRKATAPKNGAKPPRRALPPEVAPAQPLDPVAPHLIEGCSAIELMEMELEEARFAVPGYICEGLNIFAGGQKFGKSWLALGLCVAVASGGRALGQIEVEQGQVLYLALEDNPRRLKTRLGLILGEERAPKGLDIYHRWPAADAGGIPMLEQWIKKRSRARLIVIDTLGRFRGTRAKNGDIFQQDYDFGARLKRIGDEHQVAVLLLHHISKRQCDDPFDAVSGTIAVTGSADATLLMRRQRGRNDATLFVTGRDVEEREMALEWSPETYQWTLAGTAEEHAQSEERREIIEFLRSHGAMQPKAIAQELDKNPNTIRSLLRKMVAKGEIAADGAFYRANSDGGGTP